MSLDRSSMVSWCILAIALSVVLAAVAVGRFSLTDDELVKAVIYLLGVGFCGIQLRKRGWIRMGTCAEVFAQIMLASLLAALASVVLASTALPFKDEMLQAVDRRLFGVDWRQIIEISKTQGGLLLVLSHAYTTISWQPLVLLSMLSLHGRSRAVMTFSTAWVLTLAASVSVFPLMPAVGGYIHNHVARSQTHVLVAAAWRHLEILGPVRDGSLRTLNAGTLEGIITFPSFHAAAAVLLAWGFWHSRYARWPALALNIAMLASTPFVGGHYLVDVATGCVIALLALAVAARLQGASGSEGAEGERCRPSELM